MGRVREGRGRKRREMILLFTERQRENLNSSVFKTDQEGLLSWKRILESKQELQRLCQSVVMPSFSLQQRQKIQSLKHSLITSHSLPSLGRFSASIHLCMFRSSNYCRELIEETSLEPECPRS